MKIIFLLLLISTPVFSQLSKLEKTYELPVLDINNELSKAGNENIKGRPLTYAVQTKVNDLYLSKTKNSGGQWQQMVDGSWMWRLVVHAENTKSLGFGFYDFYLPPTAELRFYNYSGELAKGPFTDQKNKAHKQFWPGPIIGDKVTVDLRVADKYKRHVSFSINTINQGFRSIWQDIEFISKNGEQKFWIDKTEINTAKSGSCNVDVVCNDGDAWRDQIRAVGRYVVSGALCTGQLVNNTANDGRPFFLTANHCGINSSNDASINIWWNYESNQCRPPNSTASGTQLSIEGFNDTQSGSTYRASYRNSDFSIIELDDPPNAPYNVFYSGWDARDTSVTSAVSIHHPSGHAKRISTDNNSLTIANNPDVTFTDINTDRMYLHVNDWNKGTTEGGSSGGGLWSQDNLLVGQLFGGFAACGNNSSDWYGRINTSWEGGGTSDSRLKDWLDPINTGVQTLEGLGACNEMNISINHDDSNNKIGVAQNFNANISGGMPPFKYQWDINEDQNDDGIDATISATYSQQFVGNVELVITDSEGCTGSANRAVVIEAPRINLLNTGNTPTQVCGNNDAFIDPGERWRVGITMQNNGFQTAQNAYAVLTKSIDSNINISNRDNFGNGIGSCARTFIDISTTGDRLTFIDANPNDNFPAQDEGTATIDLPQSFKLYDQTITTLNLSSNGYFSTNPIDSGFDFDNDCPLPTVPNNAVNGSTTSARIFPLHDDLITQELYHQHFNNCPRQSELGQNLSCDIFMYKDVSKFNPNGGDGLLFDFEAILYPTVNQWVYQYDGINIDPLSATVGLQSNNATDGVSYSCNQANLINTQQAVCVFHNDNQSPLGNTTAFINLETPVISIGSLQVSQQHNDFVEFSIDENAICGESVNINMQSAVYKAGFNQDGGSILSTRIGNNGTCSIVNSCSPNSGNDILTNNGLWYNISRPGNGNDMYFTEDNLIYLQYTALPDRSPIWYITGSGYRQNNQAFNQLTKFSYDGPFLSSSQTISVVGNSLTTLIDANNAVQTRTINGVFSADLIQPFIFSGATSEQRTGLWFNSAESGWGESIGTQGDTEIIVNYLYDDSGQPYWVLGSGVNSTVEDIDMLYFKTFCPHCPSVPNQSSVAGRIRIDYNDSNNSGFIRSMQIDVDNEHHQGRWNRSNLPISLLTAPLDN